MYGHKMKQVDPEVWDAWMKLVESLKEVFIEKNIYSQKVFDALEVHRKAIEDIRAKKAERFEILEDLARRLLFCQFLNEQDNKKFGGKWDGQGIRGEAEGDCSNYPEGPLWPSE